ncbi:MAG: hypothetical protein ACKVQA_01230 [Burkholderiales bacterium]
MSTKEFALQLKKTIEDIKAKGTAAIYCDNLITYLNDVAASPSHVVTPAELEQYKAQLQLEVEKHKSANASSLEMFKSVISAGQNAIRSSFLLNGGTAFALLAFISHLAEKQPDKVAVFADTLIPFVIGVFAISLTSGFTYMSQWFYAAEDGSWKQKAGFWLNIVSIILGLSSYGFFLWGMCRAYLAFKGFV